jgi:hypothetical protein
MSALSETLGNDGPPHELEHNGKTYKVKLIDDYVAAEFEKWLFKQAKRALSTDKDELSPEEYRQKLAALNEEFTDSAYSLMSPRGARALQSPQGMLVLSSMLFGCSQLEMAGLMVDQPQEVVSLIQLVMRESFPSMTNGKAETKEDAKKK